MCLHSADALLLRALSDSGEKEIVAKLAKDMQKTTRIAWEREAKAAIDKGIRALNASASVSDGLANLDSVLSRELSSVMTAKEISRVGASVRGMYTGFKRVGTNEAGTSFSFRQFDRNAVSALAKEQPFWVGDFYSAQMSNRIRDIGQKAIVEQGLGQRAAGQLMSRVLAKDLSWAGGPAQLRGLDVIPARFAGNVGGYSEILVANVANRGRNMGFLSAYNDAGIERFRWNSVMDERTSQVCVFLDGREFAVQTGMSLMQRLVDADSPDEVRSITPWRSTDQLKQIAGTGGVGAQNEALAKAGVMVPPAHGRCRSVVEAVG